MYVSKHLKTQKKNSLILRKETVKDEAKHILVIR